MTTQKLFKRRVRARMEKTGESYTTARQQLATRRERLAQPPIDLSPALELASDEKLTAATGAAFDKQFLTMMIAHHEGAITMANEQTAKGSNPQAKALASKIVADQQAEITTMKDLLTKV